MLNSRNASSAVHIQASFKGVIKALMDAYPRRRHAEWPVHDMLIGEINAKEFVGLSRMLHCQLHGFEVLDCREKETGCRLSASRLHAAGTTAKITIVAISGNVQTHRKIMPSFMTFSIALSWLVHIYILLNLLCLLPTPAANLLSLSSIAHHSTFVFLIAFWKLAGVCLVLVSGNGGRECVGSPWINPNSILLYNQNNMNEFFKHKSNLILATVIHTLLVYMIKHSNVNYLIYGYIVIVFYNLVVSI